jgi:hypothetical protein
LEKRAIEHSFGNDGDCRTALTNGGDFDKTSAWYEEAIAMHRAADDVHFNRSMRPSEGALPQTP